MGACCPRPIRNTARHSSDRCRAGQAIKAVTIELPDLTGGEGPSSAIVLLLSLTVLAVAPALLLMVTSFTKIIVVLSITRNALGLQGVPPNQVLAGLAIFLSLFVMSPVLGVMNTDALQPYLDRYSVHSS